MSQVQILRLPGTVAYDLSLLCPFHPSAFRRPGLFTISAYSLSPPRLTTSYSHPPTRSGHTCTPEMIERTCDFIWRRGLSPEKGKL